MTEEEKRKHARRIIQEAIRGLDFCEVYEDEELADVDEEIQGDIHDLICTATVTGVTWE